MGPHNIFSKIEDLDEARSILREATNIQAQVLCKIPRRDLIQFQLKRYTPNHILLCQDMDASVEKPIKVERAIFTFKILGEKYYFQGNINRLSDGFSVRPNDLYQLQRREAYRIRVPMSYRAGIEIQSVDGKSCRVPSLVYDISNVGCRLIIPMKNFQPVTGSKFKGIFAQSSKDNFPVTGEIRHFTPDHFLKNTWSVGVRFRDLSHVVENKIIGISLDLHRTIFARWGAK